MAREKETYFQHLPSQINHYMKAKAELWAVCAVGQQSISVYREAIETYKSTLLELISALAHAQSYDLTQCQKAVYGSMSRHLFEENDIIKAFSQQFFEYFNDKPLSPKERKWKKEILEYANGLSDAPDMITKKYFTNGILKEEISFKHPFTVDDGENVYKYQPTAKIKLLPKS